MKRPLERFLVVALCAAMGWFYVWTVRSGGDEWKFGTKQRDYYNLLIDGFLAGQLNMKVEVPEALLQLKDPYDPNLRPPGVGLHDASFYKGKYYVYFGAAPAIVLMLPFRLVTGIDLPQPVAELVFVYGAFLASVGVWLAARRRYFPATMPFATLLIMAVLGLAGLEPVLLRRPHVWELPIGAGSCFAMLTLGCIWGSLHSERRRTAWFAGAGLMLALAIASRPTYLVASPLLLLPLAWWRVAERRWPWSTLLGAAIPLAIIGAALAWYNYARFESPFQFGQAYQLSLDYEAKVTHFSARYIGLNVWRYFFSPAHWSWYYPFIQPAAVPPKPPGFAGHDDVYGLLRNLPMAWLAWLVPLAWWRREQIDRARLKVWLAAAAVLFIGMAGVLICFFGSLARYESDFAPALILLACFGVLALERWVTLAWPKIVRWLPRLLWMGAAVASALFGVLFSLQLNGLLDERNPEEAREVARALNHIPAVIEKIFRLQRGAVTAKLRFVPHANGIRTVLTVGDPPRQDRVLVEYLGEDRVRFVFVQGGASPVLSRSLNFDFSRPHALSVLLGSMLPPATHPLFAHRTADEIVALTKRVQIDLDGETLIDERRQFEPSTGRVRVGADVAGAVEQRFDGQVLEVKRAAPDFTAGAVGNLAGFARLRLRFSDHPAIPREPLFAIGDATSTVLIYVHYVDDTGRIAFGTSLQGQRGSESDAMSVDVAAVHDVAARWTKVSDATQRQLELRVDGTMVFSRAVAWAPHDAVVAAGRNLSDEPGCAARYNGTLYQVQRSGDGRDPLVSPGDTLRLRLELPARAAGSMHDREPLVVTGRNSGGDIFLVEYLGESQVRFGLDHWGTGMLASNPVRLDISKPHDLEITLDSLAAPPDATMADYVKSGPVRVVVDGAELWKETTEFFTADADEVAIGRNPIGGTSAGPRFTGNLLSVERVKRE